MRKTSRLLHHISNDLTVANHARSGIFDGFHQDGAGKLNRARGECHWRMTPAPVARKCDVSAKRFVVKRQSESNDCVSDFFDNRIETFCRRKTCV